MSDERKAAESEKKSWQNFGNIKGHEYEEQTSQRQLPSPSSRIDENVAFREKGAQEEDRRSPILGTTEAKVTTSAVDHSSASLPLQFQGYDWRLDDVP